MAKSTGSGNSSGRMDLITKENTKTTKNKEKESCTIKKETLFDRARGKATPSSIDSSIRN